MYREFIVLFILFTHDLCVTEGHVVLVLCFLLWFQETNSWQRFEDIAEEIAEKSHLWRHLRVVE